VQGLEGLVGPRGLDGQQQAARGLGIEQGGGARVVPGGAVEADAGRARLVLRVERAAEPSREERRGAGQQRQVREAQARRRSTRGDQLAEVAGEAEAGDVRGRVRAAAG